MEDQRHRVAVVAITKQLTASQVLHIIVIQPIVVDLLDGSGSNRHHTDPLSLYFMSNLTVLGLRQL